MKRIIHIGLIFGLATVAFIACTSKTPQPQKTIAAPVANAGKAPRINMGDSTGEPVYDVLKPLPVFPGGEEKMFEFISKRLHYPAIALDKGVEGTVIVGFTVTNTGKIEKVHIIRSLYPACDREAIRVVKLMPRWIKGKQNGENEEVNYTLPIKFKLE